MYEGSDQETAEINKGLKALYEISLRLKIERDAFGTLNDIPRDPTGKPEDLGDITKNNIKKLFNKFKEFSPGYYSNKQEMQDHTQTLEFILDKLNEGIAGVGGIKLTL